MSSFSRATSLALTVIALAATAACASDRPHPVTTSPSAAAASPTAAASPSPAPSPSTAKPSAAPSPGTPAPAKIGTRTRSTDGHLLYVAQGLENIATASAPAGSRVVAAFYGSTAAKNLLFVGTVTVQRDVKPDVYALAQFVDDGKGMGFSSGAQLDIDPDDAWGRMVACGTGTFEQVTGVYCMWLNGQSYGFVFRYGKASAAALEDMRKARDLVLRG